MRPRERYLFLGPDPHDDAGLLALALGTAAGGRPTEHIARDLLDTFGGLRGLARAEPAALASVRGVGPARAVQLHATLALGGRVCNALPGDVVPIESAAGAARWLGPSLAGCALEEVHALYLDRQLRPARLRRISVGTRESAMICPREILRGALLCDAVSIVIAHNHPSGDPEPSPEDLLATRRVADAARAVGLQLLDHIVFAGPDRYVSLAERGAIRG